MSDKNWVIPCVYNPTAVPYRDMVNLARALIYADENVCPAWVLDVDLRIKLNAEHVLLVESIAREIRRAATRFAEESREASTVKAKVIE